MERKIKIKSLAEAQALFGPNDENIKSIEKEFKVKLTLRGEFLTSRKPVISSAGSRRRAARWKKLKFPAPTFTAA